MPLEASGIISDKAQRSNEATANEAVPYHGNIITKHRNRNFSETFGISSAKISIFTLETCVDMFESLRREHDGYRIYIFVPKVGIKEPARSSMKYARNPLTV